MLGVAAVGDEEGRVCVGALRQIGDDRLASVDAEVEGSALVTLAGDHRVFRTAMVDVGPVE